MPWLRVGRSRGRFLVHDERTGERWLADTADEVHQLAADRSADPGFHGLGDAVHAFTERLGAHRCTPCAKRQVALNRMVPALRRR